MTSSTLESTLAQLTEVQRRAVDWNDGSMLVLAGPGSGKASVLACRIARRLDSSRPRRQRFRILALTFTNKAAHDIASRVATLVPGLKKRANVTTLHNFCAPVLRQHSVHLDISSDFVVYSQVEDRQGVLDDALRRGRIYDTGRRDGRLLPVIDTLKAQLVDPVQAEQHLRDLEGWAAAHADRIAHTYQLYEDELHRANALDFNSLIIQAYRLFVYPAMARFYQRVYRYWLIDELQNANGAQYALLRRMVYPNFRNVFLVAEDDRTVYEWNGTDVRRISDLATDLRCEVVQLTDNFRCPPSIVEAANRLAVYNGTQMHPKGPARAAQNDVPPPCDGQIRSREFGSDQEEARGIAEEINRLDPQAREQTAVLARTRSLLNLTHEALKDRGVRAKILTRRDDFASPQMRWLVACLGQISRPFDQRNMIVLMQTFNNFAVPPLEWDGIGLDWRELASRSASNGANYLKTWTAAVREAGMPQPATELVDIIDGLASGRVEPSAAVQEIVSRFECVDADADLKDDLSAWHRLFSRIRTTSSLEGLLQGLRMRSTEPDPKPGTVTLATIHGAKGLEFNRVYLIGLADEVFPSWQSVRKGEHSAPLEAERRACFVAVTRTRKHLTLLRARHYHGRARKPSRFLREMGFTGASV